MLTQRIRMLLITLGLSVGTPLLFVGGPSQDAIRSLSEFWNDGHILYFSLFGALLLQHPRIRRLSPPAQWASVLAISLACGSLIEVLQYFVGRDADIWDVIRDLSGSALAVAFAAQPGSPAAGNHWRLPARAAAVSLAALLLWPLARSLADEAVADWQFPVLADFETPFEAGRWQGEPGLRIRMMPFSRTGKVLEIPLSTARYSGAMLKYFPGDWRAYRYLHADLYNPGTTPLQITCRIHDRMHELGEQRYQDRYNRRFRLAPGWNKLDIDLQAVARTPRGRTMDLGDIRGVMFFAIALPAPRLLYLDNLELSGTPVGDSRPQPGR